MFTIPFVLNRQCLGLNEGHVPIISECIPKCHIYQNIPKCVLSENFKFNGGRNCV